ncbi:hypothetical protein, partial [Rhizobium sp. L18]|uniref:hypothetical protein n=1 Tax=Rhizobium sp. L18 TaxID=2035451 RepID=UPI001AECDC1E
FSEWAYRTNPPKQSTGHFEKTDFSFMQLFSNDNFPTTGKCGSFPDSDRPDMARKMNLLRLFRGRMLFRLLGAPTSSQSAGLKRHMIHTGKCRQTAFPWAI